MIVPMRPATTMPIDHLADETEGLHSRWRDGGGHARSKGVETLPGEAWEGAEKTAFGEGSLHTPFHTPRAKRAGPTAAPWKRVSTGRKRYETPGNVGLSRSQAERLDDPTSDGALSVRTFVRAPRPCLRLGFTSAVRPVSDRHHCLDKVHAVVHGSHNLLVFYVI